MRCTLFSLLLAAGSLAFGQAGPSSPFASGLPIQTPLPWSLQKPDFGKAPPNWGSLRIVPRTVIEVPPPKGDVLVGDAQIDPEIVVRPARSRVGALPEGKLVAQNLYPGLRFQRIDDAQCGLEATPLQTTWPLLKVKEIPVTWPGMRMERAKSSIQSNSAQVDPSTR
jgi:hypothetical protein